MTDTKKPLRSSFIQQGLDRTPHRAFLRAVGMALLSATGGAAGAIFGTLFRGGARRLESVAAFDAPAGRASDDNVDVATECREQTHESLT